MENSICVVVSEFYTDEKKKILLVFHNKLFKLTTENKLKPALDYDKAL